MLFDKPIITKPNNFLYPRSPDGEDIKAKLITGMRLTGTIGAGIGFLEALYNPNRPKGYRAIVKRFASISLPIFGMGIAFVSVSNIAGKLRKKDDKVNWVLGTCAAWTFFGLCKRQVEASFFASIFSSLFAIIKKDSIQNNRSLIDVPVRRRRSLISPRLHFSFVKNRPGNWTTGLPDPKTSSVDSCK